MTGLGILGIILFPILYGVFGFISGAIFALLYNVAARFIGGVKIEVQQQT